MIGRRASAIVLAYHRVTELSRDPFGLAVRPDRFAAQIDVLRRAADVVPLGDVLRRAPAGRRRVAITLDDGYADNAEVAAPILAEKGVPATFFVVTGGLDEGAEFWWDRLEHVVLDAHDGVGPVDVELGGRPLRVDTRNEAGRQRALVALNRRMRVLRPDLVEAALGAVASALGQWQGTCEQHRRVTAEQVRGLLSAGEVGAHTRTHPLLPALDPARARQEIAGSRDDVERIVGHSVRHFAYPFGMEGAFDDAVARIVREAGLETACVNLPGVVRRRTNRYLIPRASVGDVDAVTFAARVERWFEGR